MRLNCTTTDADLRAPLASYSDDTLESRSTQPSAATSSPSPSQAMTSEVATSRKLDTMDTQLRIDLVQDGESKEVAADTEQDLNQSDDDQLGGESKPGKTTARRKVDQDRFDQWLRRKQMHLTDASSASLGDGFDTAILNCELGTDPSQKRIISSPREYQIELFEKAKQKNLIVVLPTGTGKTLIAALLIRHTIEQELIQRSAKDQSLEPRITFFLVDKVSLVHQQWKVLKSNLSHDVAKFHGQLVGALATQSFWTKQLESNMVIVCTAEVLRRCLSHGYIRMSQINLLVFDEAHHAKKNHPYSRIIKDFYVELEQANLRRPRILGMTASPVDDKAGLSATAAQLEGLLHSEIATVANPALMRPDTVGAALDQVVEYSLPSNTWETPLLTRLKYILGENKVFRRLFIFAKASTKEFGMWGADRVWHLCLTADEMLKAKATTERNLLMGGKVPPMAVIDEQTGAVEEAYQEVVRHKASHPPADLSAGHLSHKVVTLVQILKRHFRPAFDKCIVFVEQRLTAMILADLLRQPGFELHDVEPGVLLGSGTGEAGEHMSMSYSQQQEAVRKFHRGEWNLLIATAIAEEGLDIPDCNMIIRYDLYHTMIQYIQSKGRARMKNSKYFHMVQLGNFEHVKRVFDSREKERMLHAFCLSLPEDRILRGSDFDMDFFLRKERNKRVYNVASTGARLTYESSLVVLASFTASLATRPDVVLKPDYITTRQGGKFQCEIIMPVNSPITHLLGRGESSKQVAKCSASFDMCVKLHGRGDLDGNFNSVHRKSLPVMRNAHLALSSKKRGEYTMRIKPDIWNNRGLPTELFVMVLRLQSPHALGRPSRPLALLTRAPMPNVASFPLFFGIQQTSLVESYPFLTGLTVSSEQVSGLTEFTLRIFKDVFSKEYKHEPEKLPYYFAPLNKDHGHNFEDHGDPSTLVDWGCITMLEGTGDLEWEGKPMDYLEGRYVTDPHDGSRKFYTITTRDDLKPNDAQVQKVKGNGNARTRRNAPHDIWNYSVSLWSSARARIEVRNDLPVFEAEYIPLRRNLLDEFDRLEPEDNKCYICFATLKLSALSIDIVAMAYNIPAIIHRLESNLLVLEACQKLGLSIRLDLALEAMTKDSDNTEEHSVEQVNFQGGMGNNYERLEFLGDAFLKMSTSIALYAVAPEGNEFDYHVNRMVLICNKNLFSNALELGLEESVRSASFNRRSWYPEGLEQLRGKKGTSKRTHVLGDKSIADVCEALIGAAYLTGKDKNDLDMAVQAVTKLSNHKLENKNHTMQTWGELHAAFKIPEWQAAAPTAVHLHLADHIKRQMGYNFTHPRLLRCAFIHPSYSFMYEHIPHYQRLEFLGDALLDMVCVDYLYHRFPGADPQWLTEHKMAMVSNQFLGCVCVSLGFQRHMISMTGGLQQQITSYVDAITHARECAEEEALAAHRARSAYSRDFWTTAIEPPKCLPDLVEAYIGAVFVDSGFDYTEVERFFYHHIRPYFEDMHLYDTFANKHPVTFLANSLQLRFGCAYWRVMVKEMFVSPEAADEESKDENTGLGGSSGDAASRVMEPQVVGVVMVHGAVRAYALAGSGRHAKVAAAKKMMAVLEDMTVAEFKEAYSCDCTPEDVAQADPLAHATAA